MKEKRHGRSPFGAGTQGEWPDYAPIVCESQQSLLAGRRRTGNLWSGQTSAIASGSQDAWKTVLNFSHVAAAR
jgi:hypothetical protein